MTIDGLEKNVEQTVLTEDVKTGTWTNNRMRNIPSTKQESYTDYLRIVSGWSSYYLSRFLSSFSLQSTALSRQQNEVLPKQNAYF